MSTFISYAKGDSKFAVRLSEDLHRHSISTWIAERDIPKGTRWDTAVEVALDQCSQLLLVLSPDAAVSENVLDELGFALDEKKPVFPIMLRECRKPFRVRRLQHIDFTRDYSTGLSELVAVLREEAPDDVPPLTPPRIFIAGSFNRQDDLNIIRRLAIAQGFEPVEGQNLSGSIREALVEAISTCDSFIAVCSRFDSGGMSPWILWELGVATTMGIPTQILVEDDQAMREVMRVFPDRQLHLYSPNTLESVTITVLKQLYALPRESNGAARTRASGSGA